MNGLLAVGLLIQVFNVGNIQTRRNAARDLSEYIFYQRVLHEQVDVRFLRACTLQASGLNAVNLEWSLEAYRKTHLETTGASCGERLVGFMEGRLRISVPSVFAQAMSDARWTEKHGLVPGDLPKERKQGPFDFDISNSVRLQVSPPSPLTQGQVELVENGARKWRSELWESGVFGGGRDSSDVQSIEVTRSANNNSILVFGVHRNSFYIVEFALSDGRRLGFFSTWNLLR